ncbi:GNAT family N-acetyltransferase [Jiangella alkaliphila]|uniref:Protein N-acetyltransferase, RimJ/RimL family n=1 Tax=Jiangella alkaliphila TaxID=419479 RepID=A0A1H2LCN5_9ACTN|nr:GNAT family N-acetyltransferase [Jiangella alkaliphila]SDU78574.1 Protein N-acetyltransferase, RimJ/RimL family [Jiangella alkaliphila]
MGSGEHRVVVGGSSIQTPRLLLRPWSPADAEAALAIFGSDEVAKWLAPAMSRVPDHAAMRARIEGWLAEAADLEPPQGRWAVGLRDSDAVVGAVTLLAMPPHGVDLEIGWQLAPAAWGRGLAAEAGHAVAHHAFASGVDELFAVVRPRNKRGVATARRVGMEWVGETDKYYDLHLQVYRLRKGELDVPGPTSPAG